MKADTIVLAQRNALGQVERLEIPKDAYERGYREYLKARSGCYIPNTSFRGISVSQILLMLNK